ncbi:hypothetical protein BV898_12378 [Hypsibius exemplaris]|uniref:UPAR/Ly6 domain-containing protein n=1 Tax=Hypsibius exemplaris TaxID=2072580 RepID=A0A1W0WDZ2_HYPEX|nr:hypothetical protein BV898_12378 [Hypsibius exemplaris]
MLSVININILLMASATLFTAFHAVDSLRCYECRSGCKHAETSVQQCASDEDTCWAFRGGSRPDDHYTSTPTMWYTGKRHAESSKKCARMSDLQVESNTNQTRGPREQLQRNTCKRVESLPLNGDSLYGEVCLCDERDLCNGSGRSHAPFYAAPDLLFLTAFSLSFVS